MTVGPEDALQHLAGSAGGAGVSRWIGRKRWCHHRRQPVDAPDRCRPGQRGSPTRVATYYTCISHQKRKYCSAVGGDGDIEERESLRVGEQRLLLRSAHLARGRVPPLYPRDLPEPGGIGQLRRAAAAVRRAHLEDLTRFLEVAWAVDSCRGTRSELIAGLEGEGLSLASMRKESRGMGGRRRNPDARAAAWRVAPSSIPSIVFPTFKHFRRRYSPAADALHL